MIDIIRKPWGHMFNAVVIGTNDNARVVYVDAWKTRKSIYTVAELVERYPTFNELTFIVTLKPVVSLKKREEKDECKVSYPSFFSATLLMPTTPADLQETSVELELKSSLKIHPD